MQQGDLFLNSPFASSGVLVQTVILIFLASFSSLTSLLFPLVSCSVRFGIGSALFMQKRTEQENNGNSR